MTRRYVSEEWISCMTHFEGKFIRGFEI